MRYDHFSMLPDRAFQRRFGLFGSAPATLEGGGGGGGIMAAVAVIATVAAAVMTDGASLAVEGAVDGSVAATEGAIATDAVTSGVEATSVAANTADAGLSANAVVDTTQSLQAVNDLAQASNALNDTIAASQAAEDLAYGQAMNAGAQSVADAGAQSLLQSAGEGALKSAATNGLMQAVTTGKIDPNQLAKTGLTGAVTAGFGNGLNQLGANPLVANTLAGTAGGALNASLNGRDVGQGALVGGAGGAASGVANMAGQSMGLNPTAQGVLSGAVRGATSSALNNQSMGSGALSGAVVGGASSLGNQAGTAIQNAMTDSNGNNTLLGQVLGGVSGAEAKSLMNPPTTFAGVKPMGALSSATPAGTPIAKQQSSATTLGGNTGMPVIASSNNGVSEVALPGGQAGIPLASSPNASTGSSSNLFPSSGLNASGLPAPLQAGILQGEIPQDLPPEQIAQLQQLHPNLLNQLTKNTVYAKSGGHIRGYSNGGILDFPANTPYDKTVAMFTPPPEPRNSKVPYGNPTGNHWRPLAPTHFVTGMKSGGEMQEHVPEFVTGATGHYVKGRGDGQSDDIPAMLADGEYVFDADTVAQLGNGSSDAGAKLLDHFRESLREHKRSAPADKIPPKANPLAYMKEALKRHKG